MSSSSGWSIENMAPIAITGACLVICAIAAISYGSMAWEGYAQPAHAYNPDVMNAMLSVIKYSGYAALAGIPLALAETGYRALKARSFRPIQDSFTKIGKPEGTVINTVGAFFCALFLAVYATAESKK